jgi:hypothetical protein
MESENLELEAKPYIKTMTDIAGNIFYIKCIKKDGEERVISIKIQR